MIHPLHARERRKYRIPYILSIILRIAMFISLIAFALSFRRHSEITTFTIFYGRYIFPVLVLFLIITEISKIDSYKAKSHRHYKSFETTLQKQEFDLPVMSPPLYELITASYADAKIKYWVEYYVNQAIKNFEDDKSLSLYSLWLFEKEIKNNWGKYEGRVVSTIGFVPSIVYNFTFIAYPLYQFATEDIDSNKSIYKKVDENNYISIPYHALVFRSNETVVLKQALEMVNLQNFISDYKQIEFDPGTKVILNGYLNMDARGNLTLTNCKITKYTKDIRIHTKEEQLNS